MLTNRGISVHMNPTLPFIWSHWFHDQANKLDLQFEALRYSLIMSNMKPDHCFHTGPIIRREEDYQFMDVNARRCMLGKIIAFARNTNIKYTTFHVEKSTIKIH